MSFTILIADAGDDAGSKYDNVMLTGMLLLTCYDNNYMMINTTEKHMTLITVLW